MSLPFPENPHAFVAMTGVLKVEPVHLRHVLARIERLGSAERICVPIVATEPRGLLFEELNPVGHQALRPMS